MTPLQAHDMRNCEELLRNIEKELAEVKENLKIMQIKQDAHAPYIDRLRRDEDVRYEMYRTIKTRVYGTGIIGMLSTVIAIMWYAVTKFFPHS